MQQSTQTNTQFRELHQRNTELEAVVFDLKVANKNLKESEGRFRSVAEYSPDAILILDQNGTIIFWNNVAVRMFGYEGQAIVGESYTRLIPERLRDQDQKAGQSFFETGVIPNNKQLLETIALRKDGSEFPVEITFSYWKVQDKYCFSFIIRDISTRKYAEKVLTETKEFLDNIIDSSLDGIVVTDNQGYIIRVNRYFTDMLGYSEDKIKGKHATDMYPKEPGAYQSLTGETVFLDENFFNNGIKMFKQMMEQRHISNWESYLIGSDGTAIPVTQNCVLLYNKNQEMIGSVAILRNDTKKIMAENQLRKSRDTLTSLINAAPESLFLLDIDGTVIIANETLAKRLGTTVDELVGSNIYSYLPEHLIQLRRMFLEQALRDRVMVYYEDVRNDRYMANYVYPFPNQSIDLNRVAIFSWDITERKHAEEELCRHRDHLDELVRIKTEELTSANEQLQEKIYLHLQAEKALRDSEQNFRSLVELSPDGIGISHEGIVVFINSAGLKIFGAESPGQIIGKQVIDLVHPDYREVARKRIAQVTSQGNISPFIEMPYIRLDGSLIEVELASTPCFYQNKQAAQTVFRDISKRKMIEKALIESEEKFRMLAETVASAIFIVQGDFVVYANPAVETMIGCSFAEMQSRYCWDFVHPEHRERVREWGRRRLQGEDLPSRYEIKMLTRKGTVLWIDYTAAVIEYQGNPAVLGTGVDITDRKLAEEALRTSEEQYRMLVQSANSIILRMNRHGIVLFINNFGLQFFGYTRDELLGKNVIGTIVPQTDNSGRNLKEMILDIGKHPESYAVNENENMLHNGERVWVSWTNKAIINDAGYYNEILCIGHDITDRKRAEENLLAYQKQLQSLASELSFAEERERRRIAVELHDSIAQNLAISKIKISELRDATEHNGCRPLIDEIDTILQQTIREIRSLSFELCPPFLYELGFETAMEWLVEQMTKKYGIAIRCENDKQPKPLTDDIRVVLFQATRELLTNIAKHAKANTGKVSLTRQHNNIHIEVEDDGIGFDFGATESQVGSKEGGFGLFSIRERIKYLGGQLECESIEGHGTRISLIAPLKQ